MAMAATLALVSTLTAFDAVFSDTPAVYQGVKKLQSWSDKILNATCVNQVKRDISYECNCSTPCSHKLLSSYDTKKECEAAILQLRCARTEGTAKDEANWLFGHLYNSRSRSAGELHVAYRLDGVDVCEEYFTVALGFQYPNRRIQKYVRRIKVSLLFLHVFQ